MNFESLKNIEGLSEDQVSKIQETLQPAIDSHVSKVTGETFGEIDGYLQELTGVEKAHDKEYTSKYLKRAMPMYLESFSADSSKKAGEKYKKELEDLKAQLEATGDRDEIFKNYQSAMKGQEDLRAEYEAKLKEKDDSFANQMKTIEIERALPNKLNEPLYRPWKGEITKMLIESGVKIEGGKVQASEATGGLVMSIEDFITKQYPDLKPVFENNSQNFNTDNDKDNGGKIVFSEAKSKQELQAMIRKHIIDIEKVDFTTPNYSKRFKELMKENNEIYNKL